MYHRIVPFEVAERDGLQPGMFVMPETFEMHVEFLKRHFHIVPLSEFLKIGDMIEVSGNRSVCALTFDDGWIDFYKYAYPVLKKGNVPVTVFLATDYIGTMNRFWTDRLSGLLMQHKGFVNRNSFSSNALINLIEGHRGDFQSRLEFSIERMKRLRIDEIENILTEIAGRWGVDSGLNERAFLSWEEVREMKETGLITFGSHTASHPILTTLETDEVREELKLSRDKLISEGVVDPSFISFCYPNGNHNKGIAELVREVKYSMAVTTKTGWNAFETDPFTLHRIGIHQDVTSTKAMFACRLSHIL